MFESGSSRVTRLTRVTPVIKAMLACAFLLALRSDVARADDPDAQPSAVLELSYTPTARAQLAIWIESAQGQFLDTLALTEAVAFRGIGNRPGASEMNSGYRWPYGRREGVLPVWASRRAASPGAKQFPRVVFQLRVEGHASRDPAPLEASYDKYYCLSFTTAKSSRDALDAVSCASKFNSDKGRYITATDIGNHYAEPYEALAAPHTGSRVELTATSPYPPRMDAVACDPGPDCGDSADLKSFAADARKVLPEIDAISLATPPGDAPQTMLYTVPASWPAGDYIAYLEINTEGDYNATFNDTALPTPQTPDADWDYYAKTWGYAYRGQPSVIYAVRFTLGDTGEQTVSADTPVGNSSWDVWSSDVGHYTALQGISDDPVGAPGSGADRLRKDNDGHRFSVHSMVYDPLDPPVPGADGGVIDPGNGGSVGESGSSGGAAANGGGAGGAAGGAEAGTSGSAGKGGGTHEPGDDPSQGTIIEGTGQGASGAVGAIYHLALHHAGNRLRSHTWIDVTFDAARAKLPLHAYEVRVGTEPIIDEATFIQNGRQAKNATDSSEGATLLMLPTDVPAGDPIASSVGDLVPLTHYYVAVRATDMLNRHGPISVAQIGTTTQRFATVSPCFIATAAYGTPLAAEVGVLRHLRDRYLMPNLLGRAFVHAYYASSPRLAAVIAEHASLRGVARWLLAPLVSFAQLLR